MKGKEDDFCEADSHVPDSRYFIKCFNLYVDIFLWK